MEQLEVVLKTPLGMRYTLSKVKDGEQILRLIPVSPEKVKHFTPITAEDRAKVEKWLARKEPLDADNKFLLIVRKAVKTIDYDYWIANIEPSISNGKIYYAQDQDVGIGFYSDDWDYMAKDYAPERGSRLANIYELFLWYALRIVNGLWTLDYVTRNSSSAGNYANAPGSTKSLEKTCARECGGYKDGQGNTCKIVTAEGEDCYAIVGGSYKSDGNLEVITDACYMDGSCGYPDYCVGVLVLTK